MKKIFVVTPFETKYFRTETINDHVAQMASIARGYLMDEEIEVHTNFFLEQTGETDEDGTPITVLRNHDNMIQYLVEELEEIAKCDAVFKLDWYPHTAQGSVVNPFDEFMSDHYSTREIIPVYCIRGINLLFDYPEEVTYETCTPVCNIR